jgi:endonuclease/exonuclease/phosphatase family metal-dependent hydrolase
MQHFSLKVLTINIHKGFTAFNRRFILPELRDAVRTVSADIVCLQEVMGAHEVHPLHFENWPDTPHYEFLADTMWSDYAYGRNAVYPEGHHGNAVLSRFPLNIMKTATFPSAKRKTRPALLPHYPAQRAAHPRRLRASRPARSPSSGAAENAGRMGQRAAGR